MSSSFTIPKKAYDGFLDVIEMGPRKLEQLAREVEKQELTLDTNWLVKKLAAAIDDASERVERVVYSVLIPLNSLRAAFRMTANDFVELLAELIARQNPDWHQKHGDSWREVSSTVERLLAPNQFFALLSKTFQLLANRPTVARQFKILTELRPVYDDELSSTKAMVLTNTLVVDYDECGQMKNLHFTVDQADLRALQEQLDRAEKKVRLLGEQAGQLGVPVLVAGSERE
jgi:hypothetical protein